MSNRVENFTYFAPIERVNADERTVTGYAFCNEVVPGENGIQLKRSAMESATSGYMRFGAIREMHQPKAVGKCLSATWDDKGCLITAKIVDRDAWEKVKEQVFNGFSIGVRAKVMRGKAVESADWIETSLVDVPKDGDALFTATRCDDFTEVEPIDIEQSDVDIDEDIERQVAKNQVTSKTPDKINPAPHAQSVDIPNPAPEVVEEKSNDDAKPTKRADEVDPEESDEVAEIESAIPAADVSVGDLPEDVVEDRVDIDLSLERFNSLIAEKETAINRMNELENELNTVRGKLADAERLVHSLKSKQTNTAPVRFTQAIDRTFTANDEWTGNSANRAEVQRQMDQLTDQIKAESDSKKRFDMLIRLQTLKGQLN